MLMITLETTIIICIHLFNSQISGTVICFHLLQQLHLASLVQLDISFRCTRIRAHMSYIYRILTEFYNRLEWQKHDTWHNCLQLSIFHFLCRLVLADDVISTRSSLCWRYFYLFGLWSCRIALSLFVLIVFPAHWTTFNISNCSSQQRIFLLLPLLHL